MVALVKKTFRYEVECVHCGQASFIEACPEDIAKWQRGELVQNALPYLTADEREMLISGTCSACWDKMFPSED